MAYESQSPVALPLVIALQYNPEELRRQLADRTTGGEGGGAVTAREDLLRVGGPPVETLTLSAVLDAADQLAEPQHYPTIGALGLHPILAALELLVYPRTSQAEQAKALLSRGVVQLTRRPEHVPLVLFVWGLFRVLPVKITTFSITEEAFDQALNPIRARVELGLRVLTDIDFPPKTLGSVAYQAARLRKDGLALLNTVTRAQQTISKLLW